MDSELSYRGIIKRKKIVTVEEGHADDDLCSQGYETYHIHPQVYTCSVVPSWRDMRFISAPREYKIKDHYIGTRMGIWKIKPVKNIEMEELIKLFKSFEGKNCKFFDKIIKGTQKDKYRAHINYVLSVCTMYKIKLNFYSYEKMVFFKNKELTTGFDKDSIILFKVLSHAV